MTHITPTAHEKSEWKRMGEAAARSGRGAVAQTYLTAGHLPDCERVSVQFFDRLQGRYRAWLLCNEYPEGY